MFEIHFNGHDVCMTSGNELKIDINEQKFTTRDAFQIVLRSRTNYI